MNWWGKVIGGTFGFMMGGPLGAILGTALGNYFDSGLQNAGADGSLGIGATERVQSIFFATTFAIMGYIAKADGRVTRDEISMADKVMNQMQLNAQQRKVARNLFAQGKSDDFPVHDVLQQFKKECHRRRNLIQMFMEIVTATAFADGSLSSIEHKLLSGIASDLGYSSRDFEQLMARMSGQMNFVSQQSREQKLKAAYELLAISANASEQELKKAYRRQMNQHHPDKLVAKGLPEEMMDLATEKTQEIKAAYELIKESR
ncbi:MAG: co-chaperone DjlA [Gammaproteobacteria bacterium]|nr:co-chaperone DjlA [Gammaproteobacteria bacterium]